MYIQLFGDRDFFANHQLISVTGDHAPSLVANVANVASNRVRYDGAGDQPGSYPHR